MIMAIIYFDNAATSWPKPPEMQAAMNAFNEQIGASPGRSGHRLAVEAGRIVYAAREAVAELFHAPDPLRVVFTQNVTAALNIALNGLLHAGDHVIVSSMEHNSMMRPLRALERQGVQVTVAPCASDGLLDPRDIERAIQPNTVLIALNHASNVVGTIQPIAEVGRIARAHDLLFLLDTAQTAGAYPIDMQADAVDFLGFTGHKSLYGPTGTGGLIIGERADRRGFEPIMRGGTGSFSEFEEQPAFLPDKFESGTLNAIGLAGLAASIRWILARGVSAIRAHEVALTRQLIAGLQAIPGVTAHGTRNAARQTATVSFTANQLDPSAMGLRLDEEHDICCRIGLHCAPTAHKTLGTFPAGTVRFGLGALNTAAEVAAALTAVERLTQDSRNNGR